MNYLLIETKTKKRKNHKNDDVRPFSITLATSIENQLASDSTNCDV